MNRFFAHGAAVVLSLTLTNAAAQAPSSLQLQGFLTDSLGQPLDTTISIDIKLYDGDTEIWSEFISPSAEVVGGVFNHTFGFSNGFDTLDFNRPLSIGVTVGTDEEIVPRTPLRSVAYARALPGLYTVAAENDLNQSHNVTGGGSNNVVNDGVVGGVISGGGGSEGFSPVQNTVTGHWGTVSGGKDNTAGLTGTVGGGDDNSAIATNSTVAGGWGNFATQFGAAVGGGQFNTASGSHAVVSGGSVNFATGALAAIPGGSRNRASGSNSLAAGFGAKALHDGSFVWSDRSLVGLADSTVSSGENQFLIRAAGGVGIGTTAPAGDLHVSSGTIGDAILRVDSDTDNSFENDNPRLELRQDGGFIGMTLGFDTPNLGDNIFGITRRSGGSNAYDTFTLDTDNGNIAIGNTSAGSHRLRVESAQAGGSSGATLEAKNTDTGAGVAARFEANGTDVTMVVTQNSTGDLIKAFVSGDTRFLVNNAGDVTADGTISGGGADLAEAFDITGNVSQYEPGDVLVIDHESDRTLSLSSEPNSSRVAGVYATKPGVLLSNLGADESMENRVPLAVVGVVPTKVTNENGPIRRGDLLVTSSTLGRAMKATPTLIDGMEFYPNGSIIGKALQPYDGRGSAVIDVLVGVR